MQILDTHNLLFGKIRVLVIGVPLLAIMVILAVLSLFGRPGEFVTVDLKGGLEPSGG